MDERFGTLIGWAIVLVIAAVIGVGLIYSG
jgi:hypothetical protein